MLDLVNVYRVQFQKREPILLGASTFNEAISRLLKDSSFDISEDEITSISIVKPTIFIYV